MRNFINSIVAHNSDYITESVWYEDVTDAVKGVDYDHEGRVNIDTIKSQVFIFNLICYKILMVLLFRFYYQRRIIIYAVLYFLWAKLITNC